MNCYSTTGFSLGFGDFSFRLLSVDSSTSPTIATDIYTTPAVVAANEIVPVYNPDKQVILNQPYLGYIAYVPANIGIVYLNISYTFIPTSNANSTKFRNFISSITGAGVGASFSGQSSTVPTIIKSIVIANVYNASTDVNLYLNGIVLQTVTIAAGDTYISQIPLYLLNTQTLTVSNSGSTTLQVVYSYTLDVDA